MGLLSDQLLKAGLVTEEQVKKASQKPKKSKQPSRSKAGKPTPPKHASTKDTDLAQFYKQRATLERNEKKEAEKKRLEAKRIKKETHAKINQLITTHLLNNDDADIRFNFIVGTTIKYLFVTSEQQQQLADGKLAITFLGNKRVIIPANIAEEIKALSPNKVIIFTDTSGESDIS